MSGIELWVGGYLVVGVLVTEFMRYMYKDFARIGFGKWCMGVTLYPIISTAMLLITLFHPSRKRTKSR